MEQPRKLSSYHTNKTQAVYGYESSDQIFNVRQTIAFLSQGTTLEPGSIIMTGTPKVGVCSLSFLFCLAEVVALYVGCWLRQKTTCLP